MSERFFGPEWYAFLPYRYCQPVRRVTNRENHPDGAVYSDVTLECGHVLRRVTGDRVRRCCPECPSVPPYLDRKVTIIEDDIVPYEPGNPRKKGWCFVADAESKIPCVHKTPFLLVHPEFAPEARRLQKENLEKTRAVKRNSWLKQKEGGE